MFYLRSLQVWVTLQHGRPLPCSIPTMIPMHHPMKSSAGLASVPHHHSSQVISTSMSKEIMLSNTSYADYPNSLLSTTPLLYSTRKLASRYIHSTQGLTSQPLSTQSQPFESSQGTSHTLATRKRYSSKQSSQTMSSDLQKMASTVQRLSATTLRLSSAFMKRSKSTKSDMSTFTTYQTMKSLFLSQNTAASQMSVSGEIASTDFIVGLSSINTPGRQSRLVSSTDISKHRGSASSPLASLKLSTDPVLMSTSSWVDEISEVTTVASRSIFVTTSHLIKSPYSHMDHWSLPSKTKGTLDNIQTQASITSHVVLPSASRTSSIALATTKTFRNATPAPVTSFSVSTQTALLPESPKQFDGRMILQMPWQPEYQYSYTPEYQALASTITRQLTKVLQTLEGFLSVQVIRLWKSSVGVDFIVLVRKSAQVSEKSVERTIIEANNTGVLDLPLTSLQVQEKESLPTYHPTHEDKSIETWKIILIVAGILVFLMLLIICILVVSKLYVFSS
ncbi:hypothetical protein OS493_035709 [Desmophyllum pertusum]|uniref:SEA domain-containing protein n=1 Tax=Desmophyllum pertusum TaxID=174260 RepID=A0A9X0CI20_9CNID|nr:hypothetical protein OS493_035709 [Desmophyllum pertusum]